MICSRNEFVLFSMRSWNGTLGASLNSMSFPFILAESEFCSHFKLGDDRRCLEDLKELCFAKEEAEKGNTRSRVEVANTLLDVFNCKILN